MADPAPGMDWSGARLTGFRKRRGYTQAELAAKVLVTERMIRRYEKGQVPHVQRWQQLCTALDLQFKDLTKRFEDPNADLRDALYNGPDPDLGY